MPFRQDEHVRDFGSRLRCFMQGNWVKDDNPAHSRAHEPQARPDSVAVQLREDPSKVNWKDTNMKNVGSDIDKMIRKFVAEGEPAWEGVGKDPGTIVWRIEQFKVVAWPEDRYGEFYNGDSYIVLHTSKKSASSDALKWDIYYWIGSQSTQDDGASRDRGSRNNGVQEAVWPEDHNPSRRFWVHVTADLLKGWSLDSNGLNSLRYQIKGNDSDMVVVQVGVTREAMNSGDVFLLDDPVGAKLFLWQGINSVEDVDYTLRQIFEQGREETCQPTCPALTC